MRYSSDLAVTPPTSMISAERFWGSGLLPGGCLPAFGELAKEKNEKQNRRKTKTTKGLEEVRSREEKGNKGENGELQRFSDTHSIDTRR
ncbi:hypothetical protein VNO77_15970 [Canavalia gladiata]|uniref:Uncharacterized protein n=1 Tax=Canavalia gladiata TaxID=3824 RepID=A0AAN9M4Z4_CANGL